MIHFHPILYVHNLFFAIEDEIDVRFRFFDLSLCYEICDERTRLKSRNFFSSNSWHPAWHPASEICARMGGKKSIAAGRLHLHANFGQIKIKVIISLKNYIE